jgi:hypothetical protein
MGNFFVCGTEHRVSHMLGGCSTTELQLSLFFLTFSNDLILLAGSLAIFVPVLAILGI